MIQVNGNWFRRQRMRRFLAFIDRFGIQARPLRILDIGGTVRYWRAFDSLLAGRDLDITIVNLDAHEQEVTERLRVRAGDGCALAFGADSFDIVHSNSTIEHVGAWARKASMAREIRRVAPHYFVQTPNYWFPVEPHYRRPFIHWYPEAVRARMILRKKRGFLSATTFDEAMEIVQSHTLLTPSQMKALFPDGRLVRERVGPFTKSLIAVR